jgi:uncharacterized protein
MGDRWPEHPNAAAYRETADAFRAGDMARIDELIDDKVVWHIPGDHPLAGDLVGKRAVAAFLHRLGELGFTLHEHDVFASDDHVCALSEMGARRPGMEVSTHVVSIFHFRDGRQIERWLYPDDLVAWNAIFDLT